MKKTPGMLVAAGLAATAAVRVNAAELPEDMSLFVEDYCIDCHDSGLKKGGLDLTTLGFELDDAAVFAKWVRVHDKVAAGEMPPADETFRPEADEATVFTGELGVELLGFEAERAAVEGRAVRRRLNRYEYEQTLRDLLGMPMLELKNFLPEDSEAYGFNKVGEALDVSHVQMSRYLAAAEYALRAAMAPQAERPETTTRRFHTWDDRDFTGRITLGGPLVRRSFPLIGHELQRDIMEAGRTRLSSSEDEAEREKQSMAVVVSTYEPTEIRFGRFSAPYTARYRLRLSGYSIQMAEQYDGVSRGRRTEPIFISADVPPSRLRKLASFDFGPDPTVGEAEAWLFFGETIRPDAARLHRSRPPNHRNPDAGPDGMPGVAFQWLEVEGPLFDEWPPASHRVLFGDMPIVDAVRAGGESAEQGADWQGRRRRRRAEPPAGVKVMSEKPMADAERLLRSFIDKVYRRPVADEEVYRFLGLIEHAMGVGYDFTDSMIAGYTAVLCSPEFLYLEEEPGRLDDAAIATRLSYFLTNTAPDEQLQRLAEAGELHKPDVLAAQTDRLLNDARSRRFVDAFLDYWLELRLIAATGPDEFLYPEYQLDDLLIDSMIEETQLFFSELVKSDLSVENLVSSDFAMLNERLAKHYGIEGVEQGVALHRVELPADSVRGGLLTQASVLKVTANGTTTSPVKRGAWVMDRVLGEPPPPPPPAIPGLEPDTRGATTIREQLAKHRSLESCNVCHVNIDPVGFALESFDVMGGYRDRYRSMQEGDAVKGIGHNGNFFTYKLAKDVDSTGELPDGRDFDDVVELKALLAADNELLARNLARRLVVFATGAGVRFSDRAEIDEILAAAEPRGYGVRTLIHRVVQSDLFLNK